MGPIDDKLALVSVMVWHQPGGKPLPKPMMTQFIYVSPVLNELTHWPLGDLNLNLGW